MSKFVRILILVLFFATPLYSQNSGVEAPQTSAMEHLYQYPPKWTGQEYSTDRPFSERFYIVMGALTSQSWNESLPLATDSWFTTGRVGAGYQLAPVHSFELGVSLRESTFEIDKFVPNIDLSYLFNVTSYASRLEDSRRFDIFLRAGVEAKVESESNTWGAVAATRFKYNVSPSLGFYIEPQLSYNVYSSMSRHYISPSFAFGTTIQTARVRDAVNRSIARHEENLFNSGFHIVAPMAIKTNLLFDAATIANVGIEVPVATRWSVAADWIFPWWLWEDEQHCLQVLSGTLEARYWLTSSEKYERTHSSYNPLAGWFVGLYGGAGLYDLEWDKIGYQGEFYIATGVSGGYVHQLNRSLLLEFSVGVGYLNTVYRKYEAKLSTIDYNWHLIRQHDGAYTWLGPTSAKIALSWYPHFRKKGDRKR